MKKLLCVLTVLAILVTAIPTFAAGKKCANCNGSGKIKVQRNVPVFNYRIDKKGKKVRVPPLFKTKCDIYLCPSCHGKGYFNK